MNSDTFLLSFRIQIAPLREKFSSDQSEIVRRHTSRAPTTSLRRLCALEAYLARLTLAWVIQAGPLLAEDLERQENHFMASYPLETAASHFWPQIASHGLRNI